MSYNLNLNTFMRSNGYTFKDSYFAGMEIDKLNKDYDVWLRVKSKQKIGGIQVNQKVKWYHLGYLYSVRTRSERTYNRSKIIGRHSSVFYDDTPDLLLGGEKEYLGA